MSRCFPFPPPGYEKKPKSGENGDLLAKEKHKEKKHKKEDKERRDKDKSKDKQKEKKERKEKHRDKKKDKDRDKERNKTSEDQRTEIHREDKLGYDSRKADEFRDSKFTEELGRRIRHEEQGATSRMDEDISATPNTGIESTGTSTAMVNKMSTNVPVTIPRNEKLTPSFHKGTEVMEISTTTEKKKATSGEKVHDAERRRDGYLIPQAQKRTESMGNATAMEKQRAANDHKVSDRANLVERTEGMFTVNSIHRERVAGNYTLVSNAIGSSTKRNGQAMENLQSIPRRIENVGAAPATEKGRFVFPIVIGNEQRKAEGMGLPVKKEKEAEGDKKEEGHKDKERKAEGMGLPLEKGTDKKTEGKEKNKEKKAEDDKKEGHKDRERKEKKRKEKDKNRDKEKKKEEKKREKREHKRSKHDKLKENELEDHIPNLNHTTLAHHVENINAAGADGTNKREIERNPDGSDGPNKRRKEFEMNGFLHEPQHNGCPSKLPRTSVASFHPSVKNGRPTGFASGCSPLKHGGINNTKVERDLDNNGKHINGIPPVVASSSKVAVQLSPRLKPHIPPVVDSTATGKVAVQPSAVRRSPIPPVDSSSKAAVRTSHLPEPPIPADVESNGKAAIEPSAAPRPPIPSVVDSSKPPILPVVQPSSRPPHRDTKYLSTIYTVPKMEELSEPEDLDWLFNGNKPPSTAQVEADGTPPQVGAKGLQIEPADVFALPYVIPY